MTMRGKFSQWVKLTAGVISVLLVAGVTFWVYNISYTCGPDVDWVDGQCIGVTDGRVTLSPELADVLHKIRSENERVDSLGQAVVSVGYLVPMPKSPDDKLTELVRHELQGAHVAQLLANQTTTDGRLIRLLVANYGDGSSKWKRVIPDLVEKVNTPERLVAVVVTGRTLSDTIKTIDEFRYRKVPVIASRLTGNTLTALKVPGGVQGLARVAPTNNDQAKAVAYFLKSTARRGFLIQDRNEEDAYLLSLGESFAEKFVDENHELLKPYGRYNSKNGGVGTQMSSILRDICVQKPDVIFFAGRTPALVELVKEVPNRPCFDVPIRIVAGADAVEFPAEVKDSPDLQEALIVSAGRAEVSVRYTSQAHPGSWSGAPEGFAQASMSRLDQTCEGDSCYMRLFPGDQMHDGAAIIGHDAIVIVTKAIRSAFGEDGDSPGLIIQQFNGLRGAGAVPGASGWISLDENGNTVNKAVAILLVKSSGAVEWLGLRSGDGLPCVPNDARQRC